MWNTIFISFDCFFFCWCIYTVCMSSDWNRFFFFFFIWFVVTSIKSGQWLKLLLLWTTHGIIIIIVQCFDRHVFFISTKTIFFVVRNSLSMFQPKQNFFSLIKTILNPITNQWRKCLYLYLFNGITEYSCEFDPKIFDIAIFTQQTTNYYQIEHKRVWKKKKRKLRPDLTFQDGN